jgi:hypothetical protein
MQYTLTPDTDSMVFLESTANDLFRLSSLWELLDSYRLMARKLRQKPP